jgi:hypothetical protein
MDFSHAVDWFDYPRDNLNHMDDLIKMYPFNNWHYYVSPVDFIQLKENANKWIGHPVVIGGTILKVEEDADYIKTTVQNGFIESPLIIYSYETINDQGSLNTLGVFLGYEGGLIFFSPGDSRD